MVDSVTTGLGVEEPPPGDAAHPELPPLKFREMTIFSTGDMVSGVIDTAVGTFLLLYLTGVCGLSGTLAGLATFISLMIDSVADPLIGFLSDSTKSRLGRRHPYMLLSLIPCGIGLAMLFAMPPIPSQLGMFAYATGVLVMLRIAHSTFTLPFIAQGAEISRDYRERSLLGAFRSFFNIIASLACAFLGFSVFMRGETGLVERAGYAPFGIAVAVLFVAAGFLCALGTLPMRYRMHEAGPAERPSLRQFGSEIRDVARNRSFRVLFLTVLIFWIAQGVAASLNLHLNLYFWGLPNTVLQIFPLVYAAGLGLGIFVTAILLRRFEKQPVCVIGLALFCLLQLAPVVARLMGVFTVEGLPLYLTLYVILFATGVIATAVGIAFGAMMADTADEHEWLYGSRREALYFSGLTFSAKAAIGLGAFAGGIALDTVIGFPRNIAALGAHPHIAPEVLRNLGLMAGPASGVVSAISALILLGYTIDARKHAQIKADIAARKAGQPS